MTFYQDTPSNIREVRVQKPCACKKLTKKDMSTPKLIGLIGFKQVGKSTAASYLEEKYDFTRRNFKQALIDEIKRNFPDLLKEIIDICKEVYMREFTIDDLFTIKPPLMRALMINYGTDVRRKENPDYWVERWAHEGIMKLYRNEIGEGRTVTDDVRFKNEGEAIKTGGGILIRLTRDDVTTGGHHQSETEQLEIEADYTIHCKKDDLEHLYTELDKIINEKSN